MDHADWLAQVDEEVLEPDLEICDAHHHLWDSFAGMRRYLLDELVADIGSGHTIVSTVFVDCMAMYRAEGPREMRVIGETEFAQGVAAMAASGTYGPTRVAAGIVSHADLTLGDGVRPVLEAHLAASPNRFRGIRHATNWDASSEIGNAHTGATQGLLGDTRFREGFRHLEELDLSFDAWLYHTQISELAELARAFPGVPIVLDHFGGPLGIGPYAGRRDEVFADWRKGMDELAQCPNVVVKIGGLQMPINGFGWRERERPPGSDDLAEAIRPYTLHTIDRFGPDRCMFESNFPVDKISCSYRVLWNAFKRATSQLTPDERAMLFHDTAARVYRLHQPMTNARGRRAEPRAEADGSLDGT
jgi:predicted TIM-barrel fold metal-dependent hydrolase